VRPGRRLIYPKIIHVQCKLLSVVLVNKIMARRPQILSEGGGGEVVYVALVGHKKKQDRSKEIGTVPPN
jgi:hypothetical protein